MRLAGADAALLRQIVGELQADVSSQSLRHNVGVGLMRLLGADFVTSYVWDAGSAAYRSDVAINMDPSNLRRYEEYFQFHDPLTPRMARYRNATIVDRVVERRALERSEFYADFLARDGLYYGMNFFAYDGQRHLGDLRLWRAKGSSPFSEDDRVVFDLVGQVLSARLSAAARRSSAGNLSQSLTPREVDIVSALREGMGDAAIARHLHVSSATVRTHLNHIFQKLDVRSRLEVVALVSRSDEVDTFDDASRTSSD